MKWIIFIFTACFLLGCSRQSFDSEKWKNWKETESTMFMRWDMTPDLIKQHNLEGMTRSEIIDLLGKPTSETKISMGYDLGPARNSASYGSLSISLNENNVVEKFMVSKH